MADINPLRILGLSAEALRGRTDTQIRELVDRFGRALLQQDHPDRGGNEKRYKTINAALQRLADPAEFERYKTSYLKPTRGKVGKLEAAVKMAELKMRNAIAIRRTCQEAVAGVFSGPTIVDPQGYLFTVSDILQLQRTGGSRVYRTPAQQAQLFFSLRAAENRMLVKQKGEEITLTKRVLMGCIPQNNVRHENGILGLIAEAQPVSTTVPLLRGRRYKARPVAHSHFMTWESGEHILKRLSPVLVSNSYLFSAIETEAGLQLYFEGKLFKIDPIAPCE